jgi:hypothetical protein
MWQPDTWPGSEAPWQLGLLTHMAGMPQEVGIRRVVHALSLHPARRHQHVLYVQRCGSCRKAAVRCRWKLETKSQPQAPVVHLSRHTHLRFLHNGNELVQGDMALRQAHTSRREDVNAPPTSMPLASPTTLVSSPGPACISPYQSPASLPYLQVQHTAHQQLVLFITAPTGRTR